MVMDEAKNSLPEFFFLRRSVLFVNTRWKASLGNPSYLMMILKYGHETVQCPAVRAWLEDTIKIIIAYVCLSAVYLHFRWSDFAPDSHVWT